MLITRHHWKNVIAARWRHMVTMIDLDMRGSNHHLNQCLIIIKFVLLYLPKSYLIGIYIYIEREGDRGTKRDKERQRHRERQREREKERLFAPRMSYGKFDGCWRNKPGVQWIWLAMRYHLSMTYVPLYIFVSCIYHETALVSVTKGYTDIWWIKLVWSIWNR